MVQMGLVVQVDLVVQSSEDVNMGQMGKEVKVFHVCQVVKSVRVSWASHLVPVGLVGVRWFM